MLAEATRAVAPQAMMLAVRIRRVARSRMIRASLTAIRFFRRSVGSEARSLLPSQDCDKAANKQEFDQRPWRGGRARCWHLIPPQRVRLSPANAHRLEWTDCYEPSTPIEAAGPRRLDQF